MTTATEKPKSSAHKKKVVKALQSAFDLFAQSENPPTHASIQDNVWLKHARVLDKDKDARNVVFTLFSYSNLFYALESKELTSASHHNYNHLFENDGTINRYLPAFLAEKVLAMKVKYDQMVTDTRIKKDADFSQMSKEVGSDIKQINDLLAKVNSKLSKKGLIYSVQHKVVEGLGYTLNHIETNENRSFKYAD